MIRMYLNVSEALSALPLFSFLDTVLGLRGVFASLRAPSTACVRPHSRSSCCTSLWLQPRWGAGTGREGGGHAHMSTCWLDVTPT